MKRQDCHCPARTQAGGELAEKHFQRGKLVVDGDAQGLEDTAGGKRAGLLVQARQGGANGNGKAGGGGKGAAGQSRGQRRGVGFVGVVLQQFLERAGSDALEQGRGGLAPPRIHAHVQRAVEFGGESAGRVVELHGGNAQVRQDDVRAGKAGLRQYPRQPGEVAVIGGEGVRPEAQGAEAGFDQA